MASFTVNMASLKEKANLAMTKAKEKAVEVKKSASEVTKKSSEILQTKSQSVKLMVSKSVEEIQGNVDSEVEENDNVEEAKNDANSKEEDSLLTELNQHCKMSKKHRLYAAFTCYVLGGIFSVLSTLTLMGGKKHLHQFAFFYTTGNICSIASSIFLVGPRRQCQVMCHPIRRVACIIWLTAMISTLLVAFLLPRAGILVLLLIAVQYAAMLWYGASYIPYGRTVIRKFCKKAASQANNI